MEYKKENVKDKSKIYYYPICKEKNCNGILSIVISIFDFSVKYNCEKNKDHNGIITFEEFDKIFLKGNQIEECSNCSSDISFDEIYNCNICNKIYCSKCFILDEHKKNISKINSTNTCSHEQNKSYYCSNCKIYMCPKCYDEKMHINHYIENLLDYQSFKNKNPFNLEDLKSRVKEIEKAYNKIIDVIVDLEKKLNEVKNNLESGINILKKTVFNYNKNFNNKSYYNNILSIKNIDYKDCKLLEKLFVKDQLGIINEIYKKIKNRDKKIMIHFFDYGYWFDSFNKIEIIRLNNGSYFKLDSYNGKAILENPQKKTKIIELDDNIKNKYIKSLTTSIDKTKIAALLENTLIIFDCNIDNNELKIDRVYNHIFDNEKFIILTPNLDIISYGNLAFKLWRKKAVNLDFTIINTINYDSEIYNLLPVNNEYFIFSKGNNIHFYYYDLQEMKSINVKYGIVNDILVIKIVNESIIVSNPKTIAVINIKTKEIAQYYELNNYIELENYPLRYCQQIDFWNNNIYFIQEAFNINLDNYRIYECIGFDNEKKISYYKDFTTMEPNYYGEAEKVYEFYLMNVLKFKLINHSLELTQKYEIYSEGITKNIMSSVISLIEKKNFNEIFFMNKRNKRQSGRYSFNLENENKKEKQLELFKEY